MPNLLATIIDRATSICASPPFQFVQASEPFAFDRQPTGSIDQAFRIEASDVSVVGGLNYTETRIGQLRIFLARKQANDPTTAYRLLCTDAQSVTAAIVRDGVTGGGDFDVPDSGRGFSIQHDPGKEYAVCRLLLPVNYDAQL